eukprot:g50.t1
MTGKVESVQVQIDEAVCDRNISENNSAKKNLFCENSATKPISLLPDLAFSKIGKLGEGASGQVFLVKRVQQGDQQDDMPKDAKARYALKMVRKKHLLEKTNVKRCFNEKEILMDTQHPFLTNLYACFQTVEHICYVMQYHPGGSLSGFLKRQKNHLICEEWAQFYASQILIALEYLHTMGIVYRDLKPENVMFKSCGNISLVDFDHAVIKRKDFRFKYRHSVHFDHRSFDDDLSNGSDGGERVNRPNPIERIPTTAASSCSCLPAFFSSRSTRKPYSVPTSPALRRLQGMETNDVISNSYHPELDFESHLNIPESRMMTLAGTTEYVAPEILAAQMTADKNKGYTSTVDWWAYGVLLYEMHCGHPPFQSMAKDRRQREIETFQMIYSKKLQFDKDVKLSKQFKDIINKLLCKDRSCRLVSPVAMKNHPYFKGVKWALVADGHHQQPPFVPDLSGPDDLAYFNCHIDGVNDVNSDIITSVSPRSNSSTLSPDCVGVDPPGSDQHQNDEGKVSVDDEKLKVDEVSLEEKSKELLDAKENTMTSPCDNGDGDKVKNKVQSTAVDSVNGDGPYEECKDEGNLVSDPEEEISDTQSKLNKNVDPFLEFDWRSNNF